MPLDPSMLGLPDVRAVVAQCGCCSVVTADLIAWRFSKKRTASSPMFPCLWGSGVYLLEAARCVSNCFWRLLSFFTEHNSISEHENNVNAPHDNNVTLSEENNTPRIARAAGHL